MTQILYQCLFLMRQKLKVLLELRFTLCNDFQALPIVKIELRSEICCRLASQKVVRGADVQQVLAEHLATRDQILRHEPATPVGTILALWLGARELGADGVPAGSGGDGRLLLNAI